MKPIILASVVIVALTSLVPGQSAKQSAVLEQQIRRLDMAEANGLLQKNVAALEKLWAENFTVNNPRNGITHGRKEVIALIEMARSITLRSFERLRRFYSMETR